MQEDQRERLRSLTVELLLALRAEYLGTPQANVLKHWDLLHTRLRGAARTSETPEELATSMQRRLQIVNLGKGSCRALADLADYVREHSCATAWLDLLDREHGYVMALTRLAAEKRREAREEQVT